ncbi:MAG: DHH family phosphoesterase [Bacilli bacterium]|nr:DHH family phosphoesterase [Bacilli bacterium]
MNNSLFQRLLEYFHIDEKKYQEITRPVSSDTFAVGHNFKHINEAVALVKEAVDNHKKIFIYGDYDADGIMGTSILVKMFEYINYPVDYYIPSRYIDGYGLTYQRALEAIENKVDLMITVDNGVAAFEAIKTLKEHNIKVLVLDHHEIGEELPNADAILHPTFDEFGETPSSGAFVAFNFTRAYLGYFDKYLSTLASVSLISDMMPLLDYNRDLLRIVFQNYKEGEFIQFDLLKEDEPFNEATIGMKIAPKINSIGRLYEDNSPNLLVKFFTSNNKEEILHYIDWINESNEERKALSKASDEMTVDFIEGDKSLVYISETKEGLLGLVANNLMNKYHVPVVALSLEKEKGVYKGSARAPLGFNIVDAFNYAKQYTIVAGGHASAGGCSIKEEDIDGFTKKFKEYADTHPIEHIEKDYIELKLTEITKDNYKIIESFSPFGESWPRPELLLNSISTKSLYFSKTGEHIFTQVGYGGRLVGFYFGMEEVKKYPFIDLVGNLRLNTFRGYTNVEFLIKEIKQMQ